mgnify:CR=1 FL=1
MIHTPTALFSLVSPHANPLDPAHIITTFGLIAVCAIVFIECGLLVGLIFPGDSLLFITGMYIASGKVDANIGVALVALLVSAILGNLTGYFLGAKLGPRLFNRPDSRVFKQEYVTKTSAFFDKYGSRALIIARFTPIIRTLITLVAGIAGMPFRTFAAFSAIGGVLWVGSVTTLGYFLGNVEGIANHIEAITITIVVLSVIPIVREMKKAKRENSSDGTV